jgi:hypothetical protein
MPYTRAFSNLHERARRLHGRSSSLTLLYTVEGRFFYMSVWFLNGRNHSTSLKVAGKSRSYLFRLCCKNLKRNTKSQRTENWLYEGRAVETSSVHRCSSTLAAVDTTKMLHLSQTGCRNKAVNFEMKLVESW